MALLGEDERKQVAQAIAAVEAHTDAELVTVLASRSDGYAYIATLWAALIALLSPWIVQLTPYWLEIREGLLIQVGIFAVLALVLRWPPILLRLVPERVRFWRAANLARRVFIEQGLHHTDGETGLLIFVSEAEHFVEILADRGIARHVEADRWRSIVDEFTRRLKRGDTLAGFLGCVEACGEILTEHVPASREKNELPNHLILIDP